MATKRPRPEFHHRLLEPSFHLAGIGTGREFNKIPPSRTSRLTSTTVIAPASATTVRYLGKHVIDCRFDLAVGKGGAALGWHNNTNAVDGVLIKRLFTFLYSGRPRRLAAHLGRAQHASSVTPGAHLIVSLLTA